MATSELLERFLQQFVRVDQEWLELTPGHATYWHSHFGQEFRVRETGRGQIKWQVKTTVVTDVKNDQLAVQLCSELNDWAGMFAFAYDEVKQSIFALNAMSAPPEFDVWVIRLSEACHHSAYMVSRIAHKLAEVVEGECHTSFPNTKTELRDVPDATIWTLQTRQGRPEWVFDDIPTYFPDSSEYVAFFAEKIGKDVAFQQASEQGANIFLKETPSGVHGQLTAGFVTDGLFGQCFGASLRLNELPAGIDLYRLANRLIWDAYHSDEGNVFAGWSVQSGELVLRQITLDSEIRGLQARPWFVDGYHSQLLWNYTSAIAPAWDQVFALQAEDFLAQPFEIQEVEDVALQLMAMFNMPAYTLLEASPTAGDRVEFREDRNFLSIPIWQTLVVWGWFNPIGPTVSQLGVAIDPSTEDFILVFLERHPVSPSFETLARFSTLDALNSVIAEYLPGLLSNAPTFIDFDFPGPVERELFEPVLKETFRQTLENVEGSDLLQEANWIKSNHGRPWSYAGEEPSPAYPDEATFTAKDDSFGSYFSMATDPQHISSMWNQIPRAWDGAINFLLSASKGDLSPVHDMGPLLTTYTQIGIVDQ